MSQSLDLLFSLSTQQDWETWWWVVDAVDSALLQDSSDPRLTILTLLEDQTSKHDWIGNKDIDESRSRSIVAAIVSILSDANEDTINLVAEKLGDYRLRPIASQLLGWFGAAAHPMLPHLIDVSAGMSGSEGLAADAISRIGNSEDAILKGIKQELEQGDVGAFRQLIELLYRMGYGYSGDLANILFSAIETGNQAVKEEIADSICDFARKDLSSFRALLEVLAQDSDATVRAAAVRTLSEIN